jgi:type IV pilus assembly protein PilW
MRAAKQAAFRASSRSSASGFSLIELMIALVISLLIVAAVGYIYVANRAAFKVQAADSRVTDNSRIAIEYLTKDFRHAAKLGCTRPESAKAHGGVALTATLPVLFTSQAEIDTILQPPFTPPIRLIEPGWFVRGFDNGVGYNGPPPMTDSTTPATRRANTDIVALIKTSENSTQLAGRMANSSTNPSLASVLPDALPSPTAGQLFVINDCDRAEIVRGSVGPGGTPGGVLTIDTAPWNQANRLTKAYDVDATVSRFDPVIYMIQDSPASASIATPKLVKFTLSAAGSWNTVPEVVADGIEDMQVRFGVATAGFGTNSPDRYMTPAEINADADAEELWRAVRSVEIALVVISDKSDVATNATARVNEAGTDTRLRQRIMQVVSLRNTIL